MEENNINKDVPVISIKEMEEAVQQHKELLDILYSFLGVMMEARYGHFPGQNDLKTAKRIVRDIKDYSKNNWGSFERNHKDIVATIGVVLVDVIDLPAYQKYKKYETYKYE